MINPLKFFLILFFLTLICINTSFAQNWFPLEIHNRWDFTVTGFCHGGTVFRDTISVEVVEEIILNGEKYFILSRPFFRHEDNYLRIENDSLYSFNTADSVDCLLSTFNQTLGTRYYSCKYDSVLYFEENFAIYFGYPDTQQVHVPYYEPQISSFSKKFGLSFVEYFNPLCDYQSTLSGCIISGITYGQLLVSVENKKNIPSSFILSQNYPNPFNPITKIKYQIPEIRFITIKVYDALGREITTLVNEEKPAGSYEIEFSGANLTSGIYFYQLKAGNLIETKKMILLR